MVDDPKDQESADDAAEPLDGASSEPASTGLSRRDVMAIAIALLGGGTVTFALMMGSGGSRSAATAGATSAVERASAAAPALAAVRPTWARADREWLANPRRGIAVELYADEKVPVWQRKAHPVLVVRCEANRLEAFVFIESATRIEPGEGRTVRLGFDQEPDRTERWKGSAEHDALFAPDATAFARRLAQARSFRFGYTPHNAAPVVANFSVAGLSALLDPAARQCGATR